MSNYILTTPDDSQVISPSQARDVIATWKQNGHSTTGGLDTPLGITCDAVTCTIRPQRTGK